MRLATVIACTLWVTMVGIMPGFAAKRVALVRLQIDELKKQQTAEIVPPVPPAVGPLVVPPAAAGPCGGVSTVPLSSRGAAPLSAAEECALKPKDSFRECANCPELVVVPAAKQRFSVCPTDCDFVPCSSRRRHCG